MGSLTCAILIAASLIAGQAGDKPNCGCRPVGVGDTTRYYHETVEYVDPIHLRRLVGTVQDQGGDPIAGVLVEVFERGKPDAKRLDACETGEDGRFCMEWLRDGSYEVRFSDLGYDVSQFTVELQAVDGKELDEPFDVHMHVH